MRLRGRVRRPDPPAAILLFFFFFNDTATTEIYTLSLHDALPILRGEFAAARPGADHRRALGHPVADALRSHPRSEEHTSELQSLAYLVCRLLLEKKKKKIVKGLIVIINANVYDEHTRPALPGYVH